MPNLPKWRERQQLPLAHDPRDPGASYCPRCGSELVASYDGREFDKNHIDLANIDFAHMVQPDDIGVCPECGACLVFDVDVDGDLRGLTWPEWDTLREHQPELYNLVTGISKDILARGNPRWLDKLPWISRGPNLE